MSCWSDLSNGLEKSKGNQHSKTLMTDNVALIGSTNFTKRSTTNQEINVLVHLSAEGVASLKERYKIIEDGAELMGPQDYSKAQKIRDDRIANRAESPVGPRHTYQLATSHARARNQGNRRPRRSVSANEHNRGSGGLRPAPINPPQSSDSQ